MQRRGQKGGLKDAPAPTRLYEGKSIEPADCLAYPEAPIKIDQVGAVTEQHVLAVVDHLAGARVQVRGGAAAKIAPLLEQTDLVARARQGTRGREPRQSTADD